MVFFLFSWLFFRFGKLCLLSVGSRIVCRSSRSSRSAGVFTIGSRASSGTASAIISLAVSGRCSICGIIGASVVPFTVSGRSSICWIIGASVVVSFTVSGRGRIRWVVWSASGVISFPVSGRSTVSTVSGVAWRIVSNRLYRSTEASIVIWSTITALAPWGANSEDGFSIVWILRRRTELTSHSSPHYVFGIVTHYVSASNILRLSPSILNETLDVGIVIRKVLNIT